MQKGRIFSHIAIAIIITTAVQIGWGDHFQAAQINTGKETGSVEVLPKDLNIHYTGKHCDVCHEKKPVVGGKPFLRYDGDFKKLCGGCHDTASVNDIHPVNIVPSDGKWVKIPPDLPLREGRLTCSTCHDLYLQCQTKPQKTSLRGAPFDNRSQFCFKCHNKKGYVKQDVHDQINEDGDMLETKCRYCHYDKPDVEYDQFRDIKLVENIEAVCKGCHVISAFHAGNANHMIRPSFKGLARIKKMKERYGLILPLGKGGKMTCITCHNPHEKGVIPADKPSAKGADSKFRQRLPGKMCIACHDL